MASPTPTVNPITSSNQWTYFLLAGARSPGTIPHGGTHGFSRDTGWDKKKGKGTQGATLTLTTVPPVEGEITLQLFEPKDFSDWDTFVSQVLSISPTQQKTDGIPIYYPEFSSIGFVQCVIESYTGPKHVGKGLYHVKIKLAEWQPPPAVSIVSTPAKTLPNVAEDTPVRPPDPEIDALLTQIALLNKANQP